MGKVIHIFSFLVFITAIGIAIITGMNESFMRTVFICCSYYLVFAVFLIWLTVLIQTYAEKIREIVVLNWQGILFCFVLALLLFIVVPTGFKVLADETNIVAVSKSMVFDKRVENVTDGYWYYNNYWPLGSVIDKRPLLVPFFASIVHTLTGYRPENIFAVNFIMLFGLFVIIYLVAKKYLSTSWTLAVLIAVASQPIVSILENAGGLELTSLVFLCMSLYGLYSFLQDPSAERLAFLWVNLLMYLNTRYEAIVTVFIILFCFFIFRCIKWQYIKEYIWLYALSPLLLLPVFWQRILLIGKADELPPGSDIIPFSIHHVLRHSYTFCRNLFDPGLIQPYANIIILAGIVSVVYFLFFMLRKNSFPAYQKKFFWILFFVFGSLWVVTTSYYAMKPEHPSSFRVYLPFVVVLSVAAILFLYNISFTRTRPLPVLMFCVAVFLIDVPVSIENRFVNYQTLIREYAFEVGFFKKQADKNFLIVHEASNLFTVYNYGAVSFERANREAEVILYQKQRHLFRDIFVVQLINYKTLLPEKGCELSSFYQLETVDELQNEADKFIRISRVKNGVQ